MQIVPVNLEQRSYEIRIAAGHLHQLGTHLTARFSSQRTFVVSDDNVGPHAATVVNALVQAGIQVSSVTIPHGEEQKSLASLSKLYDALAEYQADRQTSLLALGGGVVGDLAGFAAATFNRGLPLVMVPTTLLAMVDSSVGGKVGINHPHGKNLIGAFHQPKCVWIDTAVLDTLPEREYRSGLAEVVKYGVILDEAFFGWLQQNVPAIIQRDHAALEHVIARCCQLKAHIVEQDEFETKGLRAILNYGHTFAHAFEKVAGYGNLLHGEAVAIGMICASHLARQRGMVEDSITRRQSALLKQFLLPIQPDTTWPITAILESMKHDKKTHSGQLRFVLPHQIGQVESGISVTEAEVREVLGALALSG